MGTLWLKKMDFVADLFPKAILCASCSRRSEGSGCCIVRPGGLGDLVVLTRAFLEEGLNPREAFWILERRNREWARYLGLPHCCYDEWVGFRAGLWGERRFRIVVNSEQGFGLAAVFASRFVGAGGRFCGFAGNRRADLYNCVVPYDPQARSERDAFRALLERGSVASCVGRVIDDVIPPAPACSGHSYCVLAVGKLGLPEPRMSLLRWGRLLLRALEEEGDVILVGAPHERSFAEEVAAGAPKRVRNLVGAIPFAEVVDLLRGASRFYGVDSGLFHIADFFGVPLVVVFGPHNRVQWGPLSPSGEVVSPEEL